MRQRKIDPLTEVSEIRITYKNKVSPPERKRITSSKDADEILRPFFNLFIDHREAMYALYTNRANEVLGVYYIGSGGVSGVAVDPKLVFQAALKCNASGIILAHNHPSGNLTASHADIQLTKKVKEACGLMDMALLDHLIIASSSYYSFADEGTL